MKIGLVCPYDLTRSGGVQEHVLAQAKELNRRGHTVKIITPRPRRFEGPAPATWIFMGNSATVRTPIKTTLELGISLGRDAMDDMLAAERFDVLHIHEPEVPVLGSQLVAKAACPVVATFHAIHPNTAMARTITTFRIPYSRSIFSRLSAMTAVSDAAAGFVRAHTRKPVLIIPNGIDLAAYQVPRQATKAPMVLYVGRLEKRKGVRYLLKAFQELQATDPTVRLVIAGAGDLRSGLEEYVRNNRLRHVTFKGYVTDAQKLRLLAEAAVFCAPALYGESFGIVLLEAMAAGVPVVAGDNPGYSSVLTGHGKLSLVNPRDTRDFARRLGIFVQDEAVRELWLDWAQRYVRQFSYDKIVAQYEQLYQKVLQMK